jgi:transposase
MDGAPGVIDQRKLPEFRFASTGRCLSFAFVLPKYACPKCRDGVVSPPVPPKPISGGIAGAGLVSFVVVSKFADHLPLYRLEDILTRHGVYLSRSRAKRKKETRQRRRAMAAKKE